MTIDVPIRQVTCLEDRAVIAREGRAVLEAGKQRLRIEGASPAIADRSLSVSVEGAQVVSARVERSWNKPPEKPLTELQEKIERLEKERDAKDAEIARLQGQERIQRLAQMDVLRAMAEQSTENAGSVEQWRAQLARAREALRVTSEALLTATREHHALATRIAELYQARLTEQPRPVLECAIELEVESASAREAVVKARYLVACAAWRPAYRARLFEREGQTQVRIEADAVVWQASGEAWSDVVLELSTERPTLGTEPPSLSEDFLRSREKSQQERKVVEVALREEAIDALGGGAEEMMGVDDGGEVRLLRAQGRSSVPSDGRPHRLPMFAFETPAKAEIVATPEKSPLASVVARFENTGPAVLLAGPVELARQSGYVGRGQIAFAGKGEEVKLSFGSEDRLRVGRHDAVETSESKLTGRRSTRHRVKVWLTNLADAPANLVVEERIPVSELAEVQIELARKESSSSASVSEDGIVRYELALEGLAKRELSLVYDVSASSKVQGL